MPTRAREGENEEETNEAARLSAGGADGERLGGGPGGPDEGRSLDIAEKKKGEKRRGGGEIARGGKDVMEALFWMCGRV